MTRLGIPALLLLSLAAPGCGARDRAAEAPGTRDSSMAGMPGMQGMPGMSEMERMGAGAPGGADTAGVPLDRAAAERLGITFARAARRPIAAGTRAVGILRYPEPRRVYVNARVMGWVEKLYADYEGKPIRKGEALLALYAPELVSAQEEYLSAKRLGDSTLVAAARRRLTLWDVPDDQIELVDRTGKAQRTLLLRAPISGEIAEKKVIEGQAVQPGDNLFLIADRRVLWVDLAIYEMDARLVRVGSRVELRADAAPGRVYRGRVTFLDPRVDTTTRTLTARVEVANRDGELRPGMYVTAGLASAAERRVTVPLTAVLPTGTRTIAFVNRGDGTFVPREVTTGLRNDSLVEIVEGLRPGDEVVASATYLLDSESNLAAAMKGLMLQMGMGLNMGGMRMEGMEPGRGAAGRGPGGMDRRSMPGTKDRRPPGDRPR